MTSSIYRPDSRKMVVRWRKGRSVVAWELKDSKHKRNEPLDLRNYATAALEIANPVLQEGEIAKPIRNVRQAAGGEEGFNWQSLRKKCAKRS